MGDPSLPGGVPPPPGPPPAGAPAGVPDAGRSALLASIQHSSIGQLRKIDKTHLDKPSVILQEAKGDVPKAPPVGAQGNASMASALAAALSARKGKVAGSDNEESDEEWD